jgi:hypothetical protein
MNIWPTISMVSSFIGYVFAFWAIWQLFDILLHKMGILKSAKSPTPHCPHCIEYEKEITNVQKQVRAALLKASEAERIKHKLDAVAEEAIAISQLNLASQAELEEIDGIGPIRAEKIIRNRPYTSWDHFEVIESRHPSNIKTAIFRWAKERVGLPKQTAERWTNSSNQQYGGPYR